MSYRVTIEPLGHSIEVEDGQTILDAALRNGIYLPHACCHGLCATCKVQVVDGEVDHGPASPFALMDVEREEGRCLACCAMPTSDVVIEADIDEDPDARHLPLQDHGGRIADLVELTPTIKGVFIELEGDGMEIGAMSSERQVAIVEAHVEDARPSASAGRCRAASRSNPPHRAGCDIGCADSSRG